MSDSARNDTSTTDTTGAPDGRSGPAAPPPRRPARRRRFGWSIQSKLLVMLLGVSVLSSVVVGVIGYANATASLKAAALDQLVSVRESRAADITRRFKTIEQSAILASGNLSAADASAAFNAGFQQLQDSSLTPQQSDQLADYYAKDFVPQLEKRSGMTFSDTAFLPTDPAERYLQYNYTSKFTDFDKAIKDDDAGDGSAWSAAHATYQPYFRDLVTRAGYDDILLLNTKGDVVYTAYKGVDLGTNVDTGPYRNGVLRTAYDTVMKSGTLDAVVTTDDDRYIPSLDVPTLWVVSPVGQDGKLTGALAYQIPISAINTVMTGGDGWAKQGLGQTGEVYLVGPDQTMRSTSRELVQHPKQYEKAAIAGGTPPDIAKRVVQVDGTVELQPVRTAAVKAALEGKTGTTVGPGYLGAEQLTAYAPLHIDGLNWVIVATINSSEAYAPVNDYARNIILSTAAIVLIVCLASLLLAQVFLRPLRRLMGGVKRVAAGEVGVQVDTRSKDEIADVGAAFNDMSRSLQVKADLLEEQQAENERLLLSLMPEGVAKRYRQGDETIAEDHQDVTVLFADIAGLDDYTARLPSDRGLAALNEIVRGFDEAADRFGVERVRTTRQEGYLASCGLNVPRVDHARRVVEFALEMQKILDVYSAQHDARLQLRAGIDTGTVTSGLVGRSSVVYDLWGDAVNLAHRLHGVTGSPGIVVTQRVVDLLPDTSGFRASGTVETQTGEQKVWSVNPEGARV